METLIKNKVQKTTQNTTMKAAITTKYGGPEVFEIQQMAIPQPKGNEVLIRNKATAIARAGAMMRTGKPYIGRLFLGLFKPKNPISGTSFAGIIEKVGKDVQTYKVGDEVYGETTFGFSTNAEYVCVPENGVIDIKPSNISFEEATPAADGALTSIYFLKEMANIQAGQRILINGASGSLGTAAVQLAKHYGAIVTGVCSYSNIDFVKSLGADHVIDYNAEDFTQQIDQYDIIYDTIGKSSFSACKKALTEKGVYMSPVGGMPLLFSMIMNSNKNKKRASFAAVGTKSNEELSILLKELSILYKQGILTTTIDRTYEMDQISEAHTYIDTGRKKGNVVMVM